MRYIVTGDEYFFFLSLFVLSSFQVKFSMYLQYTRAMGWAYTIVAFVIYFIQNVAFIGQNLWLSAWTNDAMVYNSSDYPIWLRDQRLGVFGALGVAQGSLWFCFVVCVI